MQFKEAEIADLYLALGNSRLHLEDKAQKHRENGEFQRARNCDTVSRRHLALMRRISAESGLPPQRLRQAAEIGE